MRIGCAGILAMLVSGLVVLTLAGRHIQGAPAVLTGLLTVLPWMWLSLIGLAAAAGVAIRRWWGWLPLAIATLIWGGTWGRAWVPWRSDPSATTLTVMTWNVARLWRGDEGEAINRSCVINHIQNAAPDALALLEVSATQTAALSEALGLDCAHVDYHNAGRPDAGGLAVCARQPWSLGGRWARAFDPEEPWFYMIAELTHETAPTINLLSVHLNPYRMQQGNAANRLAQADDIARAQVAQVSGLLNIVATFQDPTVVAGDFNSPRDSAVHVDMRSKMTDTWEQGAWGPGQTVSLLDWLPMRVDYIYTTKEHFSVVNSTIPDSTCSDHKPIVSTITLIGESDL